jgi:hypothetical protein
MKDEGRRMKGAVCFAAFLLLVAGSAGAEIIDRILAVVGGQLITLSDVRAVMRLRLEPMPAGSDPVRAVLDGLIDRQLMLTEVVRYGPPEPAPALVDARVQAVRDSFRDALAFETTLHESGMTAEHLRRYVQDQLRIEAYLQQRFTASIYPSDDEVAAYYRANAERYTRDGTLAPYADVRGDARARVVAERRQVLVRDWLAGLKRRADIIDLYLPQQPGGQERPGTATRR